MVTNEWNKLGYHHFTNKYKITISENDFNEESNIIKFIYKYPRMAQIIVLDSINFSEMNAIKIIKIWARLGKLIRDLKIVNCTINLSKLSTLLAFMQNTLQHLEIENIKPNETQFAEGGYKCIKLNELISFTYKCKTHLPTGLIQFCRDMMPKLEHLGLCHMNEENHATEVDTELWTNILLLIRSRNGKLKGLRFDGIKMNHLCYSNLTQFNSRVRCLDLTEFEIKQNVCERVDSLIDYQNYLAGRSTQATEMKAFLKTLVNLEKLVLKKIIMTNKEFYEIFEKMKKLKHLELTGIRKLGIINEADDPDLPNFEQIETLIILSDIIHYCDMERALLRNVNTNLQILNFVGVHMPEDGYQFFESIENLQNLQELSLGSVNSCIHDKEFQLILKHLTKPENLNRLVITQAQVRIF